MLGRLTQIFGIILNTTLWVSIGAGVTVIGCEEDSSNDDNFDTVDHQSSALSVSLNTSPVVELAEERSVIKDFTKATILNSPTVISGLDPDELTVVDSVAAKRYVIGKIYGNICPSFAWTSGWQLISTTSRLDESSNQVYQLCEYKYQWPGSPNFTPLRQKFNDFQSMAFESASVVFQEGADYESLVDGALYENFEIQTGKLRRFPQLDSSVRLAIIDNVATHKRANEHDIPEIDKSGSYPHGFNIANMARNLVCPDAENRKCAAEIVSYNALLPNGKGRQMQIAKAIGEAVRDWKNQTARRHLIINLSLGWDRLFDGWQSDRSKWSNEVEAVYIELERASCQGALIFAASGNSPLVTNELTGPVFPGAWESMVAPTPEQCARLFPLNPIIVNLNLRPSTSTNDVVVTNYRPLLYAVGAVDNRTQPLANLRNKAIPPLVAFGDHGTVPDATIDRTPTRPMTGSSVSTIVSAAAAAIVWSLRPQLLAHEVAQLLYDGGLTTDLSSNWGLGCNPSFHSVLNTNSCRIMPVGYRFSARRVTICEAAKHACESGGCVGNLGSDSLGCLGEISNTPANLFNYRNGELGELYDSMEEYSPATVEAIHPSTPTLAPNTVEFIFPGITQPTWDACPRCLYNLHDQSAVINFPIEDLNPASTEHLNATVTVFTAEPPPPPTDQYPYKTTANNLSTDTQHIVRVNVPTGATVSSATVEFSNATSSLLFPIAPPTAD